MADKLDQSLDTIMTERKKTNRRTARPARRAVSGVQKTTAPVAGKKTAGRSAQQPAGGRQAASAPPGDSKIIVSNLPQDVTELQIKDYFNQTIGSVRKVLLTYGPNGQSRGIATITFSKSTAANQAAKELDGLKVDSRAMKIEVILGAKDAPAPPPVKTLGDRIAKPKPATKDKAGPKPATTDKAAGDKKDGGRAGRGRGRARGGAKAAGRGKPKTAEELDAEMADYWGPGEGGAAAADATANGGAVQAVQPAATNGDAAMDDEIQ